MKGILMAIALFSATGATAGDQCESAQAMCSSWRSEGMKNSCLKQYCANSLFNTDNALVSHCAGAIWCYVIPERSSCNQAGINGCYWKD